jgi:hypothetical protein
MGTRRWLLAALAAMVLIVAGASWLTVSLGNAEAPAVERAQPSAKIIPKDKIFTPDELAHLQVQATESCKCARSAADDQGKKACWAELERIRTTYPGGTSVSPCGSLSPQWACFGAGEDNCIITKYSTYDEVSFCTQEEAREVEDAIGRAYRAGDKDELAIMKRFERAYRAGQKPSSRHHGECTG